MYFKDKSIKIDQESIKSIKDLETNQIKMLDSLEKSISEQTLCGIYELQNKEILKSFNNYRRDINKLIIGLFITK